MGPATIVLESLALISDTFGCAYLVTNSPRLTLLPGFQLWRRRKPC